MKHAYLIIAHTNWNQLKLLISMIDHENNDIYIHIDAKVNSYKKKDIIDVAKKSHISIMSRYKVYWGSYRMIQVEMLLFEEASKIHHDYYHLLSGMDLPIKSQRKIQDFFETYKGMEFVHFDTNERLMFDREIARRTRLFHFLQNYRRRYRFQLLNDFFTFVERVLLLIQLGLRIDRTKKYPGIKIRYGSQWVSITEDLVKYILSQETLIKKIFQKTSCSDELFIQTIVFNSDFKYRLFDNKYDDDNHANMRLIDMKNRGINGNPYVWRMSDVNEIQNSDCLFARKFDSTIDKNIIKWIKINYTGG